MPRAFLLSPIKLVVADLGQVVAGSIWQNRLLTFLRRYAILHLLANIAVPAVCTSLQVWSNLYP
jgi:hypothetical protein